MGIPVDFSEPLWQRITMTASNGPLVVRFRERAPLWFKAEVLGVTALFMGALLALYFHHHPGDYLQHRLRGSIKNKQLPLPAHKCTSVFTYEEGRIMLATSVVQLSQESIKPAIGARIFNSKQELLSGQFAGAIRELLEQRGVLVFPKIHFSDAEQIAFTRTLGTFSPEASDGQNITKISLDVKENPAGAEFLKGSLYWHIDGTSSDAPILASLLSCKVAASWGGNTGFCNTYAAYDALSSADQQRYETLRVIHAPWASLLYYNPEPGLAMLKAMQAIGEKELPLVWKHRSGRKSLILGCTAQHVVGASLAQSAQILVGLREWATAEAFSYSHTWQVGDLVIWDNTGTMHRAEAYDPECGRMMHRTKLQGEEPFE
ncbi:Dioxygenase, TauD/TfdA protein [Pseudomonas syringae pv. delphinii]|uniref:Dioxygenase, TauD/TfdA protein n=2 Tax=Pseudomonas syringae group genomosp. 3 TaxID=251701 RepID=A0A0P9QAT1_9PSED|nr:TauD/TfdA family dioxygenase [Pseudomonas syringae pv. delphinii]RMP14205.1 Dioxygenase, TauD/TfdA protein [Pseudomonas syringae pv. delphinii]RMQ21336.1 Dioxygenase, TauD/TfdA protein [Pseudomonas syringae pv. delphinii]